MTTTGGGSGTGKHARRQILDDVLSRMMGLDTDVGSSVYEDPAKSIEEDELPAIVVESGDESIQELGRTMDGNNDVRQQRFLTIDISVIALSIESRDALAARIEEDFIVFATEVGRERRLNSVSFGQEPDSTQRFWTATCTFVVEYHTMALDPYQIIRTG